MHDFSRDMVSVIVHGVRALNLLHWILFENQVLAGQQQSAELKLALDQELHKSRQLEITIKKLDEERRRSDELLYQMISVNFMTAVSFCFFVQANKLVSL